MLYKVILLTATFLFIFALSILPHWEETGFLDSDNKYAAFLKSNWKWATPLASVLFATFLIAIWSV